MKRLKFTEAQIAFILRQAEEGTPVAEVCRPATLARSLSIQRLRRIANSAPRTNSLPE